MIRPAAACLLLALGLGGCASFESQVEHGRSLAGLSRFFVVTGSSDNHALDRHLVNALRARGFTAGAGPLTMMPDDTQAVITYENSWAWDFGEHLAFLKISVRDPPTQQSMASVTFSSRVPSREAVPVIVGRLLDRLLPPKT